jgi:hypothetical protein
LEKKSQKDIERRETRYTNHEIKKSSHAGKVALLCVKENISMSHAGTGSIQRAT